MEPYRAWRTPVDEIERAYRRKIKWQNAINGVPDPDKPSGGAATSSSGIYLGPMTAERRAMVAAQGRSFAKEHNLRRAKGR